VNLTAFSLGVNTLPPVAEQIYLSIMMAQEAQRAEVMDKSNRAHSALVLATMALEHDGDGSHAAAHLLLPMEQGTAFDFRLLLKFDTTNRAHADLVMMGYRPHHLWPSRWLEEIGEDGTALMQALAAKWLGAESD
jgi:hypothetical protein